MPVVVGYIDGYLPRGDGDYYKYETPQAIDANAPITCGDDRLLDIRVLRDHGRSFRVLFGTRGPNGANAEAQGRILAPRDPADPPSEFEWDTGWLWLRGYYPRARWGRGGRATIAGISGMDRSLPASEFVARIVGAWNPSQEIVHLYLLSGGTPEQPLMAQTSSVLHSERDTHYLRMQMVSGGREPEVRKLPLESEQKDFMTWIETQRDRLPED